MTHHLIEGIRGELLKQGISIIPANSDIPDFPDIDGDLVKSAILPDNGHLGAYVASPEFHAIWCQDDEDTHITPCEGEWDFGRIADIDEYCPIRTLTMAEGANGDVFVEIAWKDYEYLNSGMYAQMVHDGLGRAIGRVLATIGCNRQKNASYAI